MPPFKKTRIETMLDIVSKRFDTFIEPRTGPIQIKLSDFLKSAYSVFYLKEPSLLSFESSVQFNEHTYSNLKKLIGIENIPSDTHLRDILDLVDYKQYQNIFKDIFGYVQQIKLLEQFSLLDINGHKYDLVAVDGTGYFTSKKVQCDHCMQYHEDNEEKETRFGHQVLAASLVHPDKKQVISFCPEPIHKQDGIKKNDCEYNAFKRFLERFKQNHPKLRVIFVLDALYANSKLVKLLDGYDYPYIISVKETKSTLFREFKDDVKNNIAIKEVDTSYIGTDIKKRKVQTYQYTQNLKLGQDKDSARVHFINFEENISWQNRKGEEKEEKKKFSYITNIEPTPKSVRILVKGGRTRWKIENETFNTLKNQGYNLEHNYDHGHKNLSMNFINTMFLAFLIDQIQEASCQKFRKLLEKVKRKKNVWRTIRSRFEVLVFEDWDDFWGQTLGERPHNTC